MTIGRKATSWVATAMPKLPFGIGAYARQRGDLPELPVVNMFAENAPTEEGAIVLQSRPGLVPAASVGTGPIRGMYQADGVFGGAMFVVSGSTLYRDGAALGVIGGSGPVSFAASPLELLVNAGTTIHSYKATGLATVKFPDSANVVRVAYIAGYFIALREGTQQWYFSTVLDGRSWDGLDFASAENEPDRLVDAVVVDDVLVLIGSRSIEFWPRTGDATIPFAATQGKVFDKGAIAPGCAIAYDNTFAFIGAVESVVPPAKPSLRVYVAANVPTGVSDVGIEEKLSKSTSYALWSFTFEGHEFLVLRLSQGTWLFDAATQQWCEFASAGLPNWTVQTGRGGLFGDASNGTLWAFGTGHSDNGGVLERRFRAGFPLSGGSVTAHNLRLTTNAGRTPDLSGYAADPVVEMRSSRDRGATWSNYRATALGQQGKYRTLIEWRRNGQFDAPGGLFEFRVTDPVPFTASAVAINEQAGGRGR